MQQSEFVVYYGETVSSLTHDTINKEKVELGKTSGLFLGQGKWKDHKMVKVCPLIRVEG